MSDDIRRKEEQRRKCEISANVVPYDEIVPPSGKITDGMYRGRKANIKSSDAVKGRNEVSQFRGVVPSISAAPDEDSQHTKTVSTRQEVPVASGSKVAKIKGNPRGPKRCAIVGPDGQLKSPTPFKLNTHGKYAIVNLDVLPQSYKIPVDANGFVTVSDIIDAAL